jgi:hypothetical protein
MLIVFLQKHKPRSGDRSGVIGCDHILDLLEVILPNEDVSIIVQVPNPKRLSSRLPKKVTGDAVISRPRLRVESQDVASYESVTQRRKAPADAIMSAASERALSPRTKLGVGGAHDATLKDGLDGRREHPGRS